MKWENITLQQFQDIYKLIKDSDIDEVDRVGRLICIVYNKTEAQVDDMTLTEFNNLAKQCDFLLVDKIPGKPVKSFRTGLKKYSINYKPTSLTYRQYVEIIHFSDKPIENMHNIMASLVNPVKWGFKLKNKAEHHSNIANDMLNAPVLAVYHSCVFFCKLYRDLIKHTRASLIEEMMSKGATEIQANQLITHSINAMDGLITTPSKLHDLKEAE